MSSPHAAEALARTRRLLLERPSIARRRLPPAHAVWRGGMRCEVTGPKGETAVTDLPKGLGGEGAAPNPGWLLRASLASCVASAIVVRAAMMGIALRVVEVDVESEADGRGLVGIDGVSTAFEDLRMAIRIGADDVPEDELRALAAWADAQAPVSCTLRRPSTIAVEVSVV